MKMKGHMCAFTIDFGLSMKTRPSCFTSTDDISQLEQKKKKTIPVEDAMSDMTRPSWRGDVRLGGDSA